MDKLHEGLEPSLRNLDFDVRHFVMPILKGNRSRTDHAGPEGE